MAITLKYLGVWTFVMKVSRAIWAFWTFVSKVKNAIWSFAYRAGVVASHIC